MIQGEAAYFVVEPYESFLFAILKGRLAGGWSDGTDVSTAFPAKTALDIITGTIRVQKRLQATGATNLLHQFDR
jgi:hypothetical protein